MPVFIGLQAYFMFKNISNTIPLTTVDDTG